MNRNSEEKVVYRIISNNDTTQSTGAILCKVTAILACVIGVIVAVSTANTIDYFGDNSFSLAAFFGTLMPYTIAGGALYCGAELLENVYQIAISLKELRVIGTVEHNSPEKPSINREVPKVFEREDPVVQDSPKRSMSSFSDPVDALSSAQKRKVIEFLYTPEREWVEPSRLGDWGTQLVNWGICITGEFYAPDGMSELEVQTAGYNNWSLKNGKKCYFKVGKVVPYITKGELYDAIGKVC